MELREIMTTNVECVPPDCTLADAARTMKTLDIGFLPVCDNDRLIGTLTDRDVVIRGLAEGRDGNATAQSVMSKDVFYCFEDDEIEHCADRMKDKEVKRMLVLNRDKRLVGVVSLGDVSKAQKAVAADALQEISEAA